MTDAPTTKLPPRNVSEWLDAREAVHARATAGEWLTDIHDGRHRVYADFPDDRPHPDGVILVAECEPAALPSRSVPAIADAHNTQPRLTRALRVALEALGKIRFDEAGALAHEALAAIDALLLETNQPPR
jgi:hypothetical protein